jgi:hypothetical protein
VVILPQQSFQSWKYFAKMHCWVVDLLTRKGCATWEFLPQVLNALGRACYDSQNHSDNWQFFEVINLQTIMPI